MKLTKIALTRGRARSLTSLDGHSPPTSPAPAPPSRIPIYAKWADAYKKETGVGLNYQSIGSGGGIKQIKAKTVTFGASDAPLPGKELDEAGLAQFPMVMGGIVPVVNLDGIKPGDLTLDGPTLAKIYPRRDQEVGRPRDRQAQSRRQAADAGDRPGPPFGRLGHDLQLHLLPVRRQPRLEVEGRHQHRRAMAGRHRRQGQRRRRQQRRARPRARSAMSSTPTPSRTS